MTTREPAVAGAFYPADPAALAGYVDRLLAAVPQPGEGGAVDAAGEPEPEALAAAYVVPHAGYRYSGPVAAEAYARLRRHGGGAVGRVVLVGPAHRVPLRGCAVTSAERWRTPLGEVPVDVAGARALAGAGVAVVDERPHAPEHSLEVQVPFLQRVLGDEVPILPVCVGNTTVAQAAAVVAAVVDEPGTVVLCSTDLSHYLPDHEARVQDRRTAAAVLDLAAERIGGRDACGAFALRGLLRWAATAGDVRAYRLALATSADTAGEPSRVVGYPAFAFHRQ